MNRKSFSNGNGDTVQGISESAQGPASVTITGVRLGAGDTHWWRLV